MRLFSGIAVPQGVGGVLDKLAHQVDSPGLRYTTVENMHLTLYFLGQVSESRVAEICAAMNALQASPVEIVVRRLGTFSRAGVLFGEVDPVPALAGLQRRVADAVAPFAPRPDPNSPPQGVYHPHITVARTRTTIRLRAREVTQLREPVRFSAHLVHLYQSRPAAGGSVYEVLHTIG